MWVCDERRRDREGTASLYPQIRAPDLRVETIDDLLMQMIRYLDKLVDELAKGKPIERVLRA